MRRAARTLCYYLSETNLNVHHWLMSYMQKNPIPRVALNHEFIFSSHASCQLSDYMSLFVPGPLMSHIFTLQSGAWDDVSGETFLRNLLSMPLEHAKWTTVSPLMSSDTQFPALGSMRQHAGPLSAALHCQAAVHVMGGCICTKLVNHALMC